MDNYRDLLISTGSPALFARTISDNKWWLPPHLAYLDQKLVELASRKIRRLIIEMPPRHGKSELSSHFFPAWWLGTFPTDEVILTSATSELAIEFSMKARDTLLEFGHSIFGVRLRPDRMAARRWQLVSGGGLRAAGVGTGIVGRGADLFLVDDYLKDVETALSETRRAKIHQWYHAVASTRMSPNGVIIVIATRWHPDDLIGRLLRESKTGGEHWERIKFPAIAEDTDVLNRSPGDVLWPEQFPKEWMESRRSAYMASGYPWQWEALYQQNPPQLLDAEWEEQYFADALLFDEWPSADQTQWRLIALDPSLGRTAKSDYSAFILMLLDNSGTMWIDADIERRDVSAIVDRGIDLCAAFDAHAFGCEEVGFQAAIEPLFIDRSSQRGFMVPYHGIPNQVNKLLRIRSTLTPFLQQRKFRFRRNSPGVALLLEQLRGFPSHRYDDGPDALEMAVRFARDVHSNGPLLSTDEYDRVFAP